jgi:hypothetical protein
MSELYALIFALRFICTAQLARLVSKIKTNFEKVVKLLNKTRCCCCCCENGIFCNMPILSEPLRVVDVKSKLYFS